MISAFYLQSISISNQEHTFKNTDSNLTEVIESPFNDVVHTGSDLSGLKNYQSFELEDSFLSTYWKIFLQM